MNNGLLAGPASVLFAGCLIFAADFASVARAQEIDDSTEADATVEEIVVTGSRLRRDRDFVAISPVQTIGLEQIQMSGNVTLAETLNEYPQLVPDNTSVTNQSGGTGVLAANLRNLGSVRTLVLVDGRRFVPADVTGLTDLTTIPSMLVERVEIVTGGASAVYGSDAIAGAVNFILRDDFEGVEFRYEYGQTSRSDGAHDKFDLLLGANLPDGRGNVTLHGSYTNRDPVFFGAREFSATPMLADANGVLQPFTVPTIPGVHVNIPTTDFDQIQGVDLVGAQASCPGPIEGLRFGENSVPAPFCRPTDGYNFAPPNFLQRPLERWQITALGDFSINDRVEVYTQMTYANKENAYQMAADAVRPTTPGQETGTLLIPNADTNPLFTQPLQDFFAANQAYFDPDGDGVFAVSNIAWQVEELGPRNFAANFDAYNLTGGVRGDFELGNRSWSWDTFYQYSRSDVSVIQANRLSQTRVALGLDPVFNAEGEVVCRAGSVLGCIPISIFGTDALTEEMADFLRVTAGRQDRFTRELAAATVAGDIFELPAGPVASAFGVEWRKEEFSTVPNQVLLSGEVGRPPFPVVNSGDYDIFEVFGELRVPLLQGMPAVENLAFEAAVRLSNYSTIGNVTTWKGAIDWQFNDWARLRGGVSRAIRAPNLDELFAPQDLSFEGGGLDRCAAISNPTPEERELCVQQGVPPELIESLPDLEPGFSSLGGGNPDLSEEEADTYTIGVVLSPLPELSVAIDYFDIDITNAISPVTGQVVLDTCLASLDINSAECQAIHRLSNGQIDFIEALLLNVATRTARGVDVQVDYGFDLPSFLALPENGAALKLTLAATKQFEETTQVVETQPPLDCAGLYGDRCSGDGIRITPDYTWLMRASWNSGPADLNAQLNYIGELELHPDALLEMSRLSGRSYLDLNGSYRIGDNVRIFGGIKNALDKDPPLIGLEAGGDSGTNVETFDPLGRRYFLGASIGFH